MTADAVGGVWNYALELARALAPHQIEVTLATMGPRPSTSQQCDAAQIGNLTLVQSDFKLEWMERPWHDVAEAGCWLIDLERKLSPCIIHLNGYAHAVLPWRAPVLVGAHSCVLSWWQSVKRTVLPNHWRSYYRHVQRGLLSADLTVAPTSAMASALEYHYGPLSRLQVIHNAVQPASHAPQTKEPFIFSAGRLWDEAKNIRSLAATACQLPWPVIVAGDPHAPDGTTFDFPNVKLLGQLSSGEAARYMGRCSIYALPAKYEPFGLSILEAALRGCALVLGDIPSLHELWGSAAVYVAPEDPRQLKSALQELILDPSRRMELGQAAGWRARQLSPERMGHQYLAEYSRLLQRSSQPHMRTNHSKTGASSCAS